MSRLGAQFVAFAVVLAAVSWHLFGDAGEHKFTFDDEDYLENTRKAKTSLHYLITPDIDKPWASRVGVHFYMWIAHKLFGDQPGPYHLVNVWVHFANAMLFLCLARQQGISLPFAGIAALLFLANTSHYRAIFWISAISLVFGVFFVLLSLTISGRKGIAWQVGSVVCYCASMLFHQTMGIAALLTPLLIARKCPLRRRLQVLASYLVPGVLLLVLERWLYGGTFAEDDNYVLLGVHVVINLAKYLFGLFVGGYSGGFGHPNPPVQIAVITGAILVVAMLALLLRTDTRLWALWVILATVPFCFWDRGQIFSRYFYFPAVASSGLLAIGLSVWARRVERAWGTTWCTALCAVVLGTILWVNSMTMEKLQAVQYFDTGKYLLLEKRDPASAIAPLTTAVERDPSVPPRVYLWLATAYAETERYSLALKVLEEVLQRHPSYSPAGLMKSKVERALRRERGETKLFGFVSTNYLRNTTLPTTQHKELYPRFEIRV